MYTKLINVLKTGAVIFGCLFVFTHFTVPSPGKIQFRTKNQIIKVDAVINHWKIVRINDFKKLTDLQMELEIYMSSVVEKNKKLTRHLQKEEFFYVDSFPVTRVSIQSVRKISKRQYEGQGTVTIRGVEQNIICPFELTSKKPYKIKGSTWVNRKDFLVGEVDKKYYGLRDSVEVLYELELP